MVCAKCTVYSPRLIQLMHEMASHQEYVPYLANQFHPAQVLVLMARSARLEPKCDVRHCLYYTWKDILLLLSFGLLSSGVTPRDADIQTMYSERIFLSDRSSSSSGTYRGQKRTGRSYFERFMIPRFESHGGIDHQLNVFCA